MKNNQILWFFVFVVVVLTIAISVTTLHSQQTRVGKQYILFLTKSEQSPNYRILTAYELKESKIYPLDDGSQFENFKGIETTIFIKTIREMMPKTSPKVGNE
ncbi:MAG TPA: hypothetical protein VF604_19975 [Pyrinomonadaceae bacterium]|jgi:membrane glycosyltransferase